MTVARDQPATNAVNRGPKAIKLGLKNPIGLVERLRSLDRVDQCQHAHGVGAEPARIATVRARAIAKTLSARFCHVSHSPYNTKIAQSIEGLSSSGPPIHAACPPLFLAIRKFQHPS